ncbi:putative gonadotropin inducible transcription factor [Operophtera brumata]|uniref:Putative gonadotropin inducible transcription factor n=1 Tax=Operophtera brumata TaxID=104452 RepID=A0A0L7LEN0_OPEBR|nr:putative gonadotropin inducible transcription factor [Operophtera brumata]
MVGSDEIDDSMVKEESLSNDDSGNFTNGGDTDDPNEIHIPVEKSKVYNCKVCQNKNFKLKENYKKHILMEHSTIPGRIPCKDCHVVCPDEETLEEHVLKAHRHPVIKCQHCSKQFTRQSHICHASFSRKDNLIVHLRTTHLRSNRFMFAIPVYPVSIASQL